MQKPRLNKQPTSPTSYSSHGCVYLLRRVNIRNDRRKTEGCWLSLLSTIRFELFLSSHLRALLLTNLLETSIARYEIKMSIRIHLHV